MNMGKYISRDLKILSIAFFFLFMGSSFQQFVRPYLQESTSWSEMQISAILITLYSVIMVWRIFIQYSVKLLGDYFSIVLASLTYSGFVLVLYLTKQYPLVILAALVWGWGGASLWIVSSTQVLDAVSQSRYGRASGIFYGATHAGFAIGVLLLGRMGQQYGKDAILLTALTAMVIGNVAMLSVPRRRVNRETGIRTLFSVMRSTKAKIVSFFLFASALGFGFLLGAFTGVARAKEESFIYLANAAFLFPLARFIVSLVGGSISDKLGRAKTLILPFFVCSAGLFLAGLWSNIFTIGISAFGLGLLGGLVPVAAMAIIGDSANIERRHLAFGALFFWRDLGVVFSLSLGQYLLVRLGEFHQCFIIFAFIFLVCALLSIVLIKREAEAF
ncbi:MFS transporter [Candidatus Poribacteria bacterium]|nr:MFS transporter [Candidatus Poribacteria bacterium]